MLKGRNANPCRGEGNAVSLEFDFPNKLFIP